MIERLVPSAVAVAEQFGAPGEAELFPDEQARIARAVAKRRQEFSSVRWCARQAMAQLGVPAAAVLPGERGAPQWPTGVVGSMTHCEGYRAAALARSGTFLGIGIDAEPHGALPQGVLQAVSLPEERKWLDCAPGGVHWDRLLFSAKESTYKAWYPLTGRWLGFEDALIHIDPAGTFTATFLVAPPQVAGRTLTQLTGRWLVSQSLVLTAIVLTASP
ncbi:MAG: 4'-phosphopantetheinyl transferase superfamily protein [Mycobacteriaceae bacterium]